VATDHLVVKLLLSLIEPTKDDILMDLGCGDGRIVIEAAKTYGCLCVGIEIDPKIAEKARKNVLEAGVEDLVLIRTGDVLDDPLVPGATIVTMYLYPDLIRKCFTRCAAARKIASVSHPLPKVIQTKYVLNNTSVFVFTKGEQ
jgi:predicted RNA methylase